MIRLQLQYGHAGGLISDRQTSRLGLCADAGRPVKFSGRIVKHVLSLRLALQALLNVSHSTDSWVSNPLETWPAIPPDPLATVHPDRIFFEVFSNDQSAYARLILDRSLFETEDEVIEGTTHVQLAFWPATAFEGMRSSRETWFSIETGKSDEAGLTSESRDLPVEWVRGFVQLQEAMTFPGIRITARPVDLLAALRYLTFTKAKTSPRALRYEFEPGQPARLVLEPWEHVVPLKGSEHIYGEKRVIRTWGRRRLQLIEPLLPYAEHVDVYLKGRAMPSFYAVRLPGVTFLLGLTGWSDQGWTGNAASDLLRQPDDREAELLALALDRLKEAVALKLDDLALSLDVGRERAARLLARLARQGKVLYDLDHFTYRHRELFAEPLDEATIFPPDSRQEKARRFLSERRVDLRECKKRETRKMRTLRTPDGETVHREVIYHDWEVTGGAGEEPMVEVVISESGRLLFGKCGCRFFRDHTLTKGPCEHFLALLAASAGQRETPSGEPSDRPPG